MNEYCNICENIWKKQKSVNSLNKYLFTNKGSYKTLLYKIVMAFYLIIISLFVFTVVYKNDFKYTLLSMFLYFLCSVVISKISSRYFEVDIIKKIYEENNINIEITKYTSARYHLFKIDILKSISFNEDLYNEIIKWYELYIDSTKSVDYSVIVKPLFIITIPLIVSLLKDYVIQKPVYIIVATGIALFIALIYDFYKVLTSSERNRYLTIIEYLKKIVIEEKVKKFC